MAKTSIDTIMEERKEAMVSHLGGNSFVRNAHFLKPTDNIKHQEEKQIFDVSKIPLHANFKSSTTPLQGWSKWVNLLLPKYQVIWKQAGIYDSILASTFKINMHSDLVLALVERWCIKTNTFVFPWGETTITLEDIVVLGGYSVLGNSVFGSNGTCEEAKKIEEELVKTYELMARSYTTGSPYTSQLEWMNHFMNTDSEIEHEAFLALWLSRYIGLTPRLHRISKSAFPIAIHLSRGTRLAIAPAILATLYSDLSRLKGQINTINLPGPLHLLLVWAWERFPTLRPIPNSIRVGDLRLARWHKLKVSRVKNVRELIDSAGEDFQWRPYCMVVNNWKFSKFYRENGEWVVLEPAGIGEDIHIFAMCVRPSELVGSSGCIEQYQPHRVAMQFGMDQDIPGFVPRFNDSFETAWSNYTRPIGDTKLYIPARLFESDVTLRYSTWWNEKMVANKDIMIKEIVRKSRSKTRKRVPRPCWGLSCEDNRAVVPFVVDNDNLTVTKVVEKEKVDGADSSSSIQEKKLKTNSELALEARVRKLEGVVAELTTERLGLIKKLSSCKRPVGC